MGNLIKCEKCNASLCSIEVSKEICYNCISKMGEEPQATRGGKRAGAGAKRKPEGERTVSRSITLTRAQWAKLDRLRRNASRSKYIWDLIDSL